MTNNDPYVTDEARGDTWHAMLGDSCERLSELPDDSVDLTCSSPPFASLFTYSPSERDLGNNVTRDGFLEHYGYIIRETLRVTKPGRVACIHVQQLTTTKATHGYMGLTDFRGQVIQAHIDAGWIFHGEITVNKDPQALRHGQRVLTPTGWTPIERLHVGDQVIGSDGSATKIEGVWPQGVGRIYRVTFSDGATVECDAAHLWTVRNAADLRNGRWQTIRTEDMIGELLSPSGKPRYEIPLVSPVEFAQQPDHAIHPYVLGALLGDGNITQRSTVSIHTQRATADRIRVLLSDGHTIREQDGTSKGDDTVTLHVGHPDWHRNDVLDELRRLGLQGCRSWEKFIPESYMRGSVTDRRELLTGLLDTDGTVKKNGSIWFTSTSRQLIDGVVEIVQSLGGLAHVREESAHTYTHNYEIREGRPIWAVCVELDGEPLVTAPRKLARWKHDRRRYTRRIVAIESDGDDERTCITVAADDGLFVTEDYVVTHNSQAIRTKAHALMFVGLKRDSSGSRPALADYLLIFKKPGDNAEPIRQDDGHPTRVTNDEWINWAQPVWWDIRESDTLNTAVAKEDADERHICPLQLGFIERCVRLWSNPDDLVLDPFGGIGSTGVVAIRQGRRSISCELKASYWATAVRNLTAAEEEANRPSLFDDPEGEAA